MGRLTRREGTLQNVPLSCECTCNVVCQFLLTGRSMEHHQFFEPLYALLMSGFHWLSSISKSNWLHGKSGFVLWCTAFRPWELWISLKTTEECNYPFLLGLWEFCAAPTPDNAEFHFGIHFCMLSFLLNDHLRSVFSHTREPFWSTSHVLTHDCSLHVCSISRVFSLENACRSLYEVKIQSSITHSWIPNNFSFDP